MRAAPDPDGVRRIVDESVEAFRTSALPLYELETWSGQRSLGGYEVQRSRAADDSAVQISRSWSVEFGDRESDQSWVMIASADHEVALREPLRWAFLARVESDATAEALTSALAERTKTAEFFEATIDNERVRFEIVGRDQSWAARVQRGDHVVTVYARHVNREGVRLQRIIDLEPFIEGYLSRLG
jgi:hypothetical protein